MAKTPEEKRAYEREYYQQNRERILRNRRERDGRNRERDREVNRARLREWKARNPDRVKEGRRRYRERNRDALRARGGEYRQHNRDELRERNRDYRERNPERHREYYARNRDEIRAKQNERYAQSPGLKRDQDLRYRHGIWPEEWASMWAAQDGCCYLCGDELPAGKDVHVDHDHRCCIKGSCQFCRRGLACNKCNVAIGMANDDPSRLRRMADALERAQADVTERMTRKPIQSELGA